MFLSMLAVFYLSYLILLSKFGFPLSNSPQPIE